MGWSGWKTGSLLLAIALLLGGCTRTRDASLLTSTGERLSDLVATEAEQAAFHKQFDRMLSIAYGNAKGEGAAAVEVLRSNVAGLKSPGEKRLLQLAILDLVNQNDYSAAKRAARARDVLVGLKGDTRELCVARIAVLCDMHRRLPSDENFAPSVLSDEWMNLARVDCRDGRFDAVREDLKEARRWGMEDEDYAPRINSRIDGFMEGTLYLAELDARLARLPDDAEANTAKGIWLLKRCEIKDATPYLAKSGDAELRHLAATLVDEDSSVDAQLRVIAGALDALEVTPAVAYILDSRARSVIESETATAKQKAEAEALLKRAKEWMGESKFADAVNEGGVRYYDSSPSRRVVYIVECSSLMAGTLDDIKRECIRSVNNMIPVQRFSAVMVSTRALAFYAKATRATADVKKQFSVRMGEIRAEGGNDDALQPFVDAFEIASAARPDVIYLISAGRFNPRLIAEVDDLNSSRSYRVRTLLFLREDPEAESRLKQLAANNGGIYKFVTEHDLKK